jgi:Kef-type K+ transport system membrane component KefB
MTTFSDPFSEIAAVLAVAAGLGALALWLRQPLIIAFIFAGVLLGPAGLDWVHALDQVDLFAKLGIGLLLFVVGLKLDPHLIRSVGRVAIVAGLGQMTMTAVVGYAVALAFGMTPISAFYVAAALTFSSTVIIVKLLSDKREIDALHGRSDWLRSEPNWVLARRWVLSSPVLRSQRHRIKQYLALAWWACVTSCSCSSS